MKLLEKRDSGSDYHVKIEYSANVDALGTLSTNITGTTSAPAAAFHVRPILREIPVVPPPASSIQSNITESGRLTIKVHSRVDVDVDTMRHRTYIDTKSFFCTNSSVSHRFASAPGPLTTPDISILVIAAADATENNTLAQTISQTVPAGQYSAVVYLRRSAGAYALPFRDKTPTIPVDSDSIDPVVIAQLVTNAVEEIIAQKVDQVVQKCDQKFQSKAIDKFQRDEESLRCRTDSALERGYRRFGFMATKAIEDRTGYAIESDNFDQLSLAGPRSSGYQ